MLDCHSSTGRLLCGAKNLIHFTSKITKLLLLLSVVQLSDLLTELAEVRVCINYSCKHSAGATGGCWAWFACPSPPRALAHRTQGSLANHRCSRPLCRSSGSLLRWSKHELSGWCWHIPGMFFKVLCGLIADTSLRFAPEVLLPAMFSLPSQCLLAHLVPDSHTHLDT